MGVGRVDVAEIPQHQLEALGYSVVIEQRPRPNRPA
jgi:hypothetical protein